MPMQPVMEGREPWIAPGHLIRQVHHEMKRLIVHLGTDLFADEPDARGMRSSEKFAVELGNP